MKKIPLTNEIASSYLSDSVSASDYEALLNQPENYIKSQFDVDINASLTIVKNQPNLINIALPYYSAIQNISSSAMTDENLESVSGGEIFGLLSIISVFTAVVVTTEASRLADEGKNLDGSPK